MIQNQVINTKKQTIHSLEDDTRNYAGDIIKKCHICSINLNSQKIQDRYRNDDISAQKFPTMTTHNGMKKELCGPCYKNHLSGMEIYKENHPEGYPKARNDQKCLICNVFFRDRDLF